jgi:hypothetical protein
MSKISGSRTEKRGPYGCDPNANQSLAKQMRLGLHLSCKQHPSSMMISGPFINALEGDSIIPHESSWHSSLSNANVHSDQLNTCTCVQLKEMDIPFAPSLDTCEFTATFWDRASSNAFSLVWTPRLGDFFSICNRCPKLFSTGLATS